MIIPKPPYPPLNSVAHHVSALSSFLRKLQMVVSYTNHYNCPPIWTVFYTLNPSTSSPVSYISRAVFFRPVCLDTFSYQFLPFTGPFQAISKQYSGWLQIQYCRLSEIGRNNASGVVHFKAAGRPTQSYTSPVFLLIKTYYSHQLWCGNDLATCW
jgi:hypothetical protein